MRKVRERLRKIRRAVGGPEQLYTPSSDFRTVEDSRALRIQRKPTTSLHHDPIHYSHSHFHLPSATRRKALRLIDEMERDLEYEEFIGEDGAKLRELRKLVVRT